MSAKKVSITVFAVLASLVALAILIYSVPVFKVNEVKIEGTSNVTDEQIEQVSGVEYGENLVRFSARQAAADIAEIPWVKTVTVERQFPKTVFVRVEERTVVAFAQEPDGAHLIDSDGLQFAIDNPPPEAVELIGGEPNSDNWKGAVEILDSLPPELRAIALSVDTQDKFSYVFHLEGDRTVVWGANEDNFNKARAMEAAVKLPGGVINVSNPELVTTR